MMIFRTDLLLALALGLARELMRHMVVLTMTAVTLRGSKPSERPALLDSLATCLACLMPYPARMRHRSPERSGCRWF
jgi:hypothetical protein